MGFWKSFTMRFTRQPSWSLLLAASNSSTSIALAEAADYSVVAAPVNWAARAFPEAPLLVMKKTDGEPEEVPGHELELLLRRPNKYWSGRLMWMATIAELLVRGNSYWIKLRDSQYRVVELWWVPGSLMTPKWPSDGTEFITHYEYKPDGRASKVDVDDVVHFRYGIDPDNTRLGLSPLASVLREVFTDQEAAQFTASILKNMGIPGLIISPDGDAVIDPEDMKAAKEELKQRYSGGRRGEPFIAGAPTKVSQFGFNPQQLDLRGLRRVSEERVSAVLGIPAIVAGLGAGLDRSTFANMKEAREMAYETTIITLQGIVGDDLANQLLDDFESSPDLFELAFDLSNVRVLQEDENAKVDRKLKELNGGAITLEEYRRETGREIKPGQDVFIRPFNVVEVPESGLGSQPSSSGDPAPDPQADGAPKMKAKETYQIEINQRMLAEGLRLEAKFGARLEERFTQLGDQVAKAFESNPFDLPPLDEPKALKADPDPQLVQLARDLALRARVADFAKETLSPDFEAHYDEVMKSVQDISSEVSGLTSIPDPVARSVVAEGGTRAGLVDITDGTRGAIYRALSDARAAGEGPPAIARRIRDQVPAGRFVNAGPKYRAQLIARTETKWAQNRSSLELYNASPNVRGVIAFDAQGADSDPDCINRDGTEFSFADADREMANEHPNGTLSFAPVVA